MLTRPYADGSQLAVDWSANIDPPRPSGFNEIKYGKRPLIYYDLQQVRRGVWLVTLLWQCVHAAVHAWPLFRHRAPRVLRLEPRLVASAAWARCPLGLAHRLYGTE